MSSRARVFIVGLAFGIAAIVTAGCTSNNQVLLPGPGGGGGTLGTLAVADHIAGDVRGTIDFFNKTDSGAVPPRSRLTSSGMIGIHSVARDLSGNIYVGTNDDIACTGSILVFPAGSSGVVTPSRTISGTTNTTLDDSIQGIALDSSGNLYVTQDDSTLASDGCSPASAQLEPRIAVFGPAATGDVAPVKKIFTPFTSFDDLVGVTVDGSGNVWVAVDHDGGGGNVYEMPNTNGTPAPMKTLTGVNEPWGVAVDASGNVYVVEQGVGGNDNTPAILVYDSGSTTPNGAKTITGASTKLCAPHDIRVDGTNIWVSNGEVASGLTCDDPSFTGISVWNVGDVGNIAPRRVIAGAVTTMQVPEELSL